MSGPLYLPNKLEEQLQVAKATAQPFIDRMADNESDKGEVEDLTKDLH